MSSNKKEINDNSNNRESQIDEYILKLRDELQESGVFDDELITAVAKIYSNSVLIAYKKHIDA